jgi:D-alanyl-D-alanine dipeptidase
MSWKPAGNLSHSNRFHRAARLLPVLALLAACAPAERSHRETSPPLRITPRIPIEELRRQALSARPPDEPGPFRESRLVDLSGLDPDLQFDIRYATERNFLGVPVYSSAQALLQAEAAWALVKVQRALAKEGLGLLIYDAYRPWHVTWIFWEATPPNLRQFVADPAQGSRHNRGCAVDLTLYDLRTGVPLPMPTAYDDFSPAAHIDYAGASDEERRNRDRLRRAMEAEGFEPFPPEWWHYDFHGWRQYPILNTAFEDIGAETEEVE